MSFWTGRRLLNRARAANLIVPFEPDLIDCSAYQLRLGGEAFTTRDGKAEAGGVKSGWVDLKAGTPVYIPSGQFAFLLTKEIVKIPHDAVGFISVRANRKLDGLINVSGFHVDPGWESRLIFGVYNAGPQTITLRSGEALFLLFYADLKDEPMIPEKGKYDDGIPAPTMQKMSAPVPSLYRLNEVAVKHESDIREAKQLAQDAKSHAGWTATFAAISMTLTVAVFGTVFLKIWVPSFFSDPAPSPAGQVSPGDTPTSAGTSTSSASPAQPVEPPKQAADKGQPKPAPDRAGPQGKPAPAEK